MKYADWNVVQDLATRQVGKFSVYVSNQLNFDRTDSHIWDFVLSEIVRLFGDKTPEYFEYLGNLVHGGLFFFESEDAAWNFYHIFNKELTYSSSIYVAIYSPTDGCLTENT